MPHGNAAPCVTMRFEAKSVRIPLADIQLLRPVAETVRRTRKSAQIATSLREIGTVEPLVDAHDRAARGKLLLLDGHLRPEALKDMGEADTLCLIATDPEAYTYNNRIGRLAIIQEHRMILKAIERGILSVVRKPRGRSWVAILKVVRSS